MTLATLLSTSLPTVHLPPHCQLSIFHHVPDFSSSTTPSQIALAGTVGADFHQGTNGANYAGIVYRFDRSKGTWGKPIVRPPYYA